MATKTTKKSTSKSSSSRKKTSSPMPETTVVKSSPVIDTQSSTRKNRIIIGIIAVIIVIAGLGYLGRSLFVAATVNGTIISRFAVIKQLESQGGKRILDNMIAQELIKQEAKKQHVTVDEKEVDKELTSTKAQIASQGQSLEAMGMTENDLRDQIRLEKMIEAILGKDIKISDADVDKFIQDNKSFLPQSSDEAQLRNMARQQLVNQELQNKMQPWLADLQKKANVTYFVSY